MTDIKRPAKPPPKDLKASGKALWRNIIGQYALDPAEVVLLHQLCRAVDVLDRIAADLAEMGVTTMGSQGQPIANPLLNEQREQVKIVDRLQQALALPLTGETAGVRRSASRKAAARADTGGRKLKGRAEAVRKAYGNG
jgi:P27 family predicted phage terminase small subunit